MADITVWEATARDGLIPIRYADNGDGTYSRSTYNVSGAAGAADRTVWTVTDTDGMIPVLYHDNGDGTYSETVYVPA